MTRADAMPVLAALGDRVPPALRDPAAADADAGWAAWVKRRDAELRSRRARGDEDSVVNLMLYGTTFTRRPRATPEAIGTPAAVARVDDVMEGRVMDLVMAIERPGDDERLRFARQVIERQGIDVGPRSRDAARRYLRELRSRLLSENERSLQRLADAAATDESQRRAAYATLYRDRGLSSDTSPRVDFALERALGALRDRSELPARPLARAVCGMSPILIMSVGFGRVDAETGSHERSDSIFVYRKK